MELGESPAAPANDTSVWAIGDSLALHPGLPQLVQQHLAPGDAPGQANRGDKLVTLVASALAGGDGINDADVLCQRRRKQGGGRGQGRQSSIGVRSSGAGEEKRRHRTY